MPTNCFEPPSRYGDTGDAIIRMRGITKTFHSAAGEATVLKGIDLDILKGQFVSVVGRSGSGKSTLVNMITGIDRPSSGTIQIDSRQVLKMPESDRAVWRGKNLGIVFQFFQLLPMLTLVENVMLPMDFCNIFSPSNRERRAMELLARVGLDGLAHKLPGSVAGGQQQCAAVARALANDPPILIADEPTGNLDSTTAGQVMEIFEDLAEQGKTILIVTHDRTLARRTNRRLIISDGELVSEILVAIFPDATQLDLLRLGKQAVAVKLHSGMSVPQIDDPADPIFIVSEGEMISVINNEDFRFSWGHVLDPFGNFEKLHAGENGATLLALPREAILSLVFGSGRVPASLSPGLSDVQIVDRWLKRARRAI